MANKLKRYVKAYQSYAFKIQNAGTSGTKIEWSNWISLKWKSFDFRQALEA